MKTMDMTGKKLLVKMVFGSHLYGLNTPRSDQDFKGVVIPSSSELLANLEPYTSYEEQSRAEGQKKNTNSDTDTTYFTLKAFLRLLAEGQSAAFEMLFTPRHLWLASSPEWEELVANRHRLVHKQCKSFFGYARKQAYKYSNKGDRIKALKLCLDWSAHLPPLDRLTQHRDSLAQMVSDNQHLRSTEGLPLLELFIKPTPQGNALEYVGVCKAQWVLTSNVKFFRKQLEKALGKYGTRSLAAEVNDGDFKALSHALRVGFEAVELLTTHKMTLPLPDPYRTHLLAVKQGLLKREEVEREVEGWFVKIQEAEKSSTLPLNLDEDYVAQFLNKAYGEKRE